MTDKAPIGERIAPSVAEAYRDGQTAMAMAKSEAWTLRSYLERRANALRKEADEIEAFIKHSTTHTDSWYDELVERRDYCRQVERKAT